MKSDVCPNAFRIIEKAVRNTLSKPKKLSNDGREYAQNRAFLPHGFVDFSNLTLHSLTREFAVTPWHLSIHVQASANDWVKLDEQSPVAIRKDSMDWVVLSVT
jgi:hypothetical protein